MSTLSKFTVQESIFDGKSMLDENNVYNQRFGKPDKLTEQIVYMFGDFGRDYPIHMATFSDIASKDGNKTKKLLSTMDYTFPVMGRIDKASALSEDCSLAAVNPETVSTGAGHGKFHLRFTDNLIKRYYIIQSARGVQAHVKEDPIKIGDAWDYLCQLDPASATDVVPTSELKAGTLWIGLSANVAQSESRGTETTNVTPGLVKNQMGKIRLSMSWAGNVANSVMTIKMKHKDGATTDLWMDFFMYQFERKWMADCEHLYWYSRYNKQADGTIMLKDELTGKPIPRGSGLLEQIGNYSTYTRLSFDGLANKISNALFGQSDTSNMSITLYTGRGGMREIDRMLKEKGLQLLTNFGTGNIADKFITGTGSNLMLGGYFDGFYHIDGYVVKVKHNPLFDYGRVAMVSPMHPVHTKLPLESFRMVFIDDSSYDGQNNLQHVALKGEEFKHGVVAGMASMPKSLSIMHGFNLMGDAAQLISSEVDKSSYHRMMTGGVQLLRSNKCFHLECVAGLS